MGECLHLLRGVLIVLKESGSLFGAVTLCLWPWLCHSVRVLVGSVLQGSSDLSSLSSVPPCSSCL